jgi:GTP cyclohydrolase II
MKCRRAQARLYLAVGGHTSVSRGLGEFRGRWPVPITATGEAVLVLPVEGLDGLPAVLAGDVVAHAVACEESIVRVEADAVSGFADDAIRSLIVASEASVPLNSGTPTRFVVFRDAMGGSPVAIIVGKPDFTNAVPVRLHSACLTGNVFGSRRCYCGDQLRLVLALLEDLGGGIILYLAPEARRLGLANKIRTYQLQDDGLDTFDANTTLGFDDDERDYSIAARMLRMLYRTLIAAHQQSGQALRSHKGRH